MQHVFLREEHFLGRHFHSQIAARHHDAVHLLQDLRVVLQTFLVLDLRDDLDVLQVGTQHAADCVDVGAAADERRRDAIHAVVLRELRDIANVLRVQRDRRENTLSVSVGSVMMAPGMFMFLVWPIVAVFSALQRIELRFKALLMPTLCRSPSPGTSDHRRKRRSAGRASQRWEDPCRSKRCGGSRP